MFYVISLICACTCISILDARFRRITNMSVLGLMALQCSLLIKSEIYLESALLVLTVGFVLFWRRWIAAGDIKLASVLALALPLSQLPMAATLMGLAGGLVSLFYLMLNHWFPNRKKRQVGIPYGVAISLGFCLVIVVHQVPLLLKA
ncbi:A24 family peptidase [Vibrio sp. CB1-14]|uniref:Prepilin peptidase n=1 Tax=Vibrio chaetopteri TaxID=3016528 RepID=A0AAU8BCX4_9VIBR